MILSFRDRATEDLFNGIDSTSARKISTALWSVVARKLDMLNAAHDLRDLLAPPGNRLEKLKGNWTRYHSIRVSDQYRIVFRWTSGNAHDVMITDYHI